MNTTRYALALYAALNVFAACKSPDPPPTAPATAAETAYTTALLRCVDEAKTLAESRACRQRVDTQWGIVEREAGAR